MRTISIIIAAALLCGCKPTKKQNVAEEVQTNQIAKPEPAFVSPAVEKVYWQYRVEDVVFGKAETARKILADRDTFEYDLTSRGGDGYEWCGMYPLPGVDEERWRIIWKKKLESPPIHYTARPTIEQWDEINTAEQKAHEDKFQRSLRDLEKKYSK